MSSTAVDWTSVLINLCNLAVNVLCLLGEEPVRRWVRQRSATPTTGSGDTEMGQGGELEEVRRSISQLTVRLDNINTHPTVSTASPPAPAAVPDPPIIIIMLPVFILAPAPPSPPHTVFTETPTVTTEDPTVITEPPTVVTVSRSSTPDIFFSLPPSPSHSEYSDR
ncbi:hypothetical protein M441DRAFT_451918 [Trichoderma asperellum CBS 433.97]|uniref:Uncharacterized protein n=1 Tax=Trichoderma asperellum (strain ATCC 204424 / CBS 433.97 / NBRC 101777) TaxID=1042311 RepID=A0A2T3ZLH3_TRIA4|nr:hypothetical protein M441DRAFT_451918 [Trichoderma asperellum CBS 433.97]PTB45633.1 hypothetical protein M441DRAFT_451918 [Trichoderma asperellum CBS 433.97]